MLPLPDLDDRFFDEIVKEARMLIPAIMPMWTDENEHDPGITFIELFAWLVEMQQYYMNRVVRQSEVNFLKLLGMEFEQKRAATVDVSITEVTKEIVLPKGTKFAARELIFETDDSHLLIPNKIEKVVVRAGAEINDYTSLNDGNQDSFYAFGNKVIKGNTLYIGFQNVLAAEQEFTLSMYMFEDYSVAIGKSDAEKIKMIPSGKVTWRFFGEKNYNSKSSKKGWFPLEMVEDDTFHMSKSGKIKMKVPFPMCLEALHPVNDRGRYWISCTVDDAAYELSPRIKQIAINHVTACHRETLSETFLFDGDETIELDNYLSFYEKIVVQVKDENGYWHVWNEVIDEADLTRDACSYFVIKDSQTKKTKINFGKRLAKRVNNVRVISFHRSFEADRYIGKSNGLPNQRFQLYDLDILPQFFMVQVGRKIDGYPELVWEDWHQVDNFMNSSASDLHFVYDDLSQTIIFGDNEKGFIPVEANVANICMIQCHVGGGQKGNIKQQLIENILNEDEEVMNLIVTNHRFAKGGREKETIAEAKLRFQKELETQKRAVTSEDFETIVKQTPGIRVGRVKAIPLYTVGLKDYPNNKVPAQVTVVVVPYSESNRPIPSQGFLTTVKNYLDKHRLVTTEVHVIPPEYIKITIYAVVVVEPYLKDEPTKIIHALEQLLHPLKHETTSSGWDFGRSVYKGDIYGVINEIEGVTFVKDLWIEGEGKGIQKEASGNILIPPHGLVYSGQHQIEVISKNEL